MLLMSSGPCGLFKRLYDPLGHIFISNVDDLAMEKIRLRIESNMG